LAKIESPTQTEPHPAESAHSAISSISGTVVAPVITPRFGRVRPKRALLLFKQIPNSQDVNYSGLEKTMVGFSVA
jgi:hypothetical protein